MIYCGQLTMQSPSLIEARLCCAQRWGAPTEFDQEFFDRITACLTAGEVPLRDVGLLAAGAAQWVKFRSALERIANADPEAEVHEMARAVLHAYDEFLIN